MKTSARRSDWFGRAVVAAIVLFVALKFATEIIITLCFAVTVIQIIAVGVATVMQFKAVEHEHRLTTGTVDIIDGWCLIGLIPTAAFGYFQWKHLMQSPWMLLLPCTACFAAAYLHLYWNIFYRWVADVTEGRDYALASRGSPPIAH